MEKTRLQIIESLNKRLEELLVKNREELTDNDRLEGELISKLLDFYHKNSLDGI